MTFKGSLVGPVLSLLLSMFTSLSPLKVIGVLFSCNFSTWWDLSRCNRSYETAFWGAYFNSNRNLKTRAALLARSFLISWLLVQSLEIQMVQLGFPNILVPFFLFLHWDSFLKLSMIHVMLSMNWNTYTSILTLHVMRLMLSSPSFAF